MVRGLGPNIQRGALATLDELYLLHLQSDVATINVPAGGEAALSLATTVAAVVAAHARGFTRAIECAASGVNVLRFDPAVGLPRYQPLAAEGCTAACSIVELLEQGRTGLLPRPLHALRQAGGPVIGALGTREHLRQALADTG